MSRIDYCTKNPRGIFLESFNDIVWLFKADLDDGDYDELEVPASGDPHLSPVTVVEYQKIFRDIISSHMMDTCAKDYMVGGPGTTIEIDESQYGWIFFVHYFIS